MSNIEPNSDEEKLVCSRDSDTYNLVTFGISCELRQEKNGAARAGGVQGDHFPDRNEHSSGVTRGLHEAEYVDRITTQPQLPTSSGSFERDDSREERNNARGYAAVGFMNQNLLLPHNSIHATSNANNPESTRRICFDPMELPPPISEHTKPMAMAGTLPPTTVPPESRSRHTLLPVDQPHAPSPSIHKQLQERIEASKLVLPRPPAPLPQTRSQTLDIHDCFFSEDDSSSEELNSLNGSDKATYHGPQHEHRLIDLDWAFEQYKSETKSTDNDRDSHGTTAIAVPPESASSQFSLLPNRHQRCLTPQRQLQRPPRSLPTSPKSPTSPRSQTSRSETYHHTFEANPFTSRNPAPPFVVVPSSGNARVTVTTVGCVRTGDEEDSLTNQTYWRRGIILGLGAVIFLGVLTMVSGLLGGTFQEATTQPPAQYEPLLGHPPAPAPADSAQPPAIFETFEPVTTPAPVMSFPVDVTRAPGIFPPIDGKIAREETSSPTISPEPTILRTKRPVDSVEEQPLTHHPTFTPTQNPSESAKPSLAPTTYSVNPSNQPSSSSQPSSSAVPSSPPTPNKSERTGKCKFFFVFCNR